MTQAAYNELLAYQARQRAEWEAKRAAPQDLLESFFGAFRILLENGAIKIGPEFSRWLLILSGNLREAYMRERPAGSTDDSVWMEAALKAEGENMSGGSYDYAYQRVNYFIDELEKNQGSDPLRIAFCEHLKKVSKAMHDIEWVDSGDYRDKGDHEAIKACLAPSGIDEIVKQHLRKYAESLLSLLDDQQ